MRTLRYPHSFASCRRGVSAVEFAIIAPVLMILLFGIICYGMYFGMLHSVQQIAAEAARAAVGGLSDSERIGLAQANIAVTAPSYPFVDATRLTVASAVTDARTNSFALTLSYDASKMAIFQLPAFVPLPSAKIQRSAVVMRGGL